LAGAISKTASGGEIDALDPGGFGAVTITKPITIDGGGNLLSVLNPGFNGIVVNSTGPNDTVTIRRVSINGAGTGVRGIFVTNVHNLIVEDSYIFGQSTSAITVATPNLNTNIAIRNVSLSDNAAGFVCAPPTGVVRIEIEDSRIDQNSGNGVDLAASCKAAISHTSISENGGNGVILQAGTADANIAESWINFNNVGITANVGQAFLFASQLSHNNTSISTAGGGTVSTHQNNAVLNNTTNVTPTPNVGQQ
jgi:hypothetical protein